MTTEKWAVAARAIPAANSSTARADPTTGTKADSRPTMTALLHPASVSARTAKTREPGTPERTRTVRPSHTPSTAVTAFPVGERPRRIAGEKVDTLWGAFPFTAAFNVAGVPAASLPCGLVDGRPAGIQLVCAFGREDLLLDICEQLEEALEVDRSAIMERYARIDGPAAREPVP